MSAGRRAWRHAREAWRHGDYRILAAAVFLAVLAIVAVGMVAERAQRSLDAQASAMVGGDAVIESDTPPDPAWIAQAAASRLHVAQWVQFNTMVGSARERRLGSARAVDAKHPTLAAFSVRGAGGTMQAHAPAHGEAWLAEQSARSLQARIGDDVQVGSRHFRLSGLVTSEPGRPVSLFEFGPRVVVRLDDVEGSDLLGPGARADHFVAVNGSRAQVRAWTQGLQPKLGRGQELRSEETLRPELRSAMDRARRVLDMATLLTVILASVAVAMAARQHAERHRGSVATLRALGASQAAILRLYLGTLALVALFASLAGAGVALLVQEIGVRWLESRLQLQAPAGSAAPVVAGLAVGGLMVASFAAPPIIAMRRVPTLAVLRNDLRMPDAPASLLLALGLLFLAGILWWITGDARTAGIALVAVALTCLALLLVAWLAVRLAARVSRLTRGITRYSLSNLQRRSGLTVAQVTALGTSLMALLLLISIRTDIWDRWQSVLQKDAPNRFVINILPDQVQGVEQTLATLGIATAKPYAMVRGRLLQQQRADGGTIPPPDNARGQRSQDRDFNLSSSRTLMPGNRISAGTWWDPAVRGTQFSVEERFATRLGWQLGDRITFDVAGQPLQGRITSLRKVEWETLQPNFFVLVSPGVLDAYPATYLTAVREDVGETALAKAMGSAFPNISVVDVDAIMTQVRQVGDQAARVVQLVFWFAFAAGVLVFVAAVNATLYERVRELGVLRTLGARSRQLRWAQFVEFASIGIIAGLVAASAASLAAGAFAREALDLPWQFNPRTFLLGAAGGAVAASLAGLASMARHMRGTVRDTLRGMGHDAR